MALVAAPAELLSCSVVKSGYLFKRSLRKRVNPLAILLMGQKWKKRWFVLRGNTLSYYKDDKEYIVRQVISISDVYAISEARISKREHVFGLLSVDQTLYLQAACREEMLDWIEKIKSHPKYGECRRSSDQSSSVELSRQLSIIPFRFGKQTYK